MLTRSANLGDGKVRKEVWFALMPSTSISKFIKSTCLASMWVYQLEGWDSCWCAVPAGAGAGTAHWHLSHTSNLYWATLPYLLSDELLLHHHLVFHARCCCEQNTSSRIHHFIVLYIGHYITALNTRFIYTLYSTIHCNLLLYEWPTGGVVYCDCRNMSNFIVVMLTFLVGVSAWSLPR